MWLSLNEILTIVNMQKKKGLDKCRTIVVTIVQTFVLTIVVKMLAHLAMVLSTGAVG